MTNEQKYKTEDERIRAFGEFCKNEFCNQCNHLDCKLYKQGSAILHCYDGWLSLEADEEEIEPCIYCGHKMHVYTTDDGNFVMNCDNCGYVPKSTENFGSDVAAHNRVARAVRAENESEVNNG